MIILVRYHATNIDTNESMTKDIHDKVTSSNNLSMDRNANSHKKQMGLERVISWAGQDSESEYLRRTFGRETQ